MKNLPLIFQRVFVLKDLPDLSREILDLLPERGKIALCGDLGAGKTTLVRSLVSHKNPELAFQVLSPTFSLINEYEWNGKLWRHADLYRLQSLEEIEVMDLFSQADEEMCFVEWANLFPEIMQMCSHHIFLSSDSEGVSREIKIFKNF